MDTHKKIREHISAFADGTLCNIERELAMAALHTPDGRQTWQLYHRIGDVLRSEAVAELSPGFAERLAARLDQEPLPLRRNPKAGAAGGPGMHLLPAAQDGAGGGASAMACDMPGATAPGAGCGASGGAEAMAVAQAKPAVISVS